MIRNPVHVKERLPQDCLLFVGQRDDLRRVRVFRRDAHGVHGEDVLPVAHHRGHNVFGDVQFVVVSFLFNLLNPCAVLSDEFRHGALDILPGARLPGQEQSERGRNQRRDKAVKRDYL